MYLRLAELADNAHLDRRGKLHITGVFDRIYSPTFPMAHSGAYLALILACAADESGEHIVEVNFIDEDGHSIWTIEVRAEVEGRGSSFRTNVPLPLPPFALSHPGEYSLEVFIDGYHRRSVELTAELTNLPPSGDE